jgi:transcriptional regulator with XRE-family HTH domain
VLRGHRRAARLTLEQLAEASGVSARALSDLERGRSKGVAAVISQAAQGA